MTEKRNWVVNVILLLAVLAFVGFSMVPLLSSVMQPNRASSPNSPSPMASGTAPQKEDLESRAKGYESVLQREPENQTALRGLLEARLQLIGMGYGEVKDVIEPLEKLVKLNPQEMDYSVLLAQAKQQVGDREGAAKVYRDVLASQPGNLKALNGLVTLLLQQNRPEAAIGLLQDTLKTAPQANKIQAGSVDVTSVQLELARVYANEKRYSEAIAIYDEAAKANATDFRPILGKAMVLKAEGKTEEAKPLFESAAELAPPQFKDPIKQMASDSATPPSGSTAPVGGTPSPAPSAAPASPEPVPAPQASPQN